MEPGAIQTGLNDKVVPTPGYGPGTPYWDTISAQWERLGSTIWKNGILTPDTVADTIFAAATDDRMPLFVPVGKDAELSVALRGRGDLATYPERLDAALDRFE